MQPRTSTGVLATVAVLTACILAACTSTSSGPTFGVSSPYSNADIRARLDALAGAEVQRTDTTAGPLGTMVPGRPRLADADLGFDANESIADMLDTFVAEPLVSTPPPPKSALSDLDRRAALAAYTSGREAMIRLDPEAAIGELERATALDPDAPEAWRALAEAQITLGLRASAMVSLERAISLGLEEPRALTLAGIDALSRRQIERATRLLARAERSPIPDADPGLGIVRRAALGEAALERGRLLAGAQLISEAIATPPQLTSPTRVGAELGALFRRRPELWLRAGDAYAAIGDAVKADAAYSNASNLPGADTPAIAGRRLGLALESGRLALAAGLLYDRFIAADGLVTTRDVRLITAMADAAPDSEAVATLRDGIAAVIANTPDPTPTRRLSLLRAFAAAQLRPDRDRTLLAALAEEHLAGPDAQRTLSSDLFASPGTDADATASLVRRAVSKSPSGSLDIVRTAVERSSDPTALIAALRALRVAIIDDATAIAVGRPRDVETSPDRALESPRPMRTAHAALLAESAASTGRWADADAHRDTLASAGALVPLLRTQLAAQRFDDAARTAQLLADEADPLAWRLIVASDALRLVGDPVAAAQLADRALALDPESEPAFERVLALRGIAGPAADPAAADRVAGVLRTSRPTSRLLRLLVTQELIRRQLADEARMRIEELAAEDPLDPSLLDQQIALVRLAASSNRSADAVIEEIRATAETYPGSLPAARSLAVGLTILGRADEAAEALEATIEITGTDALNRVLERVLRDAGQPDRADERQRARLERTPRSIDETLEAAALQASGIAGWSIDHARPSSPGAILDTVREGIPDSARLTAEQRADAAIVLVRTIAQIPESRNGSGTQTEQEHAEREDTEALDLIAWAADRGVEMSPALHGRRVALLGRTGAATSDLAAAVRTAVTQHPAISAELLASTIGALNTANRQLDAAALVADVFLTGEAPYPESLRPDFFRAMLSLMAASRDPEGVRRLIEQLDDAGHVGTVLDVVNFRPDGGGTTDPKADFAYTVAVFANATDGERVAEPLYRVALVFQPDHVWSANDLGYSLLERGESLEDAERLITLAAVNAPDQHNIVDSLGWLRYHQGRLETPEGVAEDDLANLGAIDLLRRATDLLEAQPARTDEGVIVDHLGDALARAGRLAEARVAWLAAREQANSRLRALSLQQQTETPAYRRIAELARTISLKVQRAERGETPDTPEPRFAPAGTD